MTMQYVRPMYFRFVMTSCLAIIGRTKAMPTSGYATWFTAGGAIRIAHYDVIDDVITQEL